jgi:TetR/AcrR family transcriptional regulator, transcriptional repressor for nem operon
VHIHCTDARRDADMTDDTTATLSPRGRATHARIVRSAADLFYRQGLSNTTIGDIRDVATVSGSQISHYFPDRRALIRGVIAARRNELVDFHTSGRLSRLDNFQALQDWAELSVQLQLDLGGLGCIFGSLVSELSPSDEEIRTEVTAVYDELIATFRTALAAMLKRGELRPDADPRHLARVLVVAHQGGSMLAQVTRSAKPLRDSLDGAVQYICSFATHPVTLTTRSTPRKRTR